MIYNNEEHMNLFLTLKGSIEYKQEIFLPVLYIMTSSKALYKKMHKYIYFNGSFRVEEMFANEQFSGSELLLAKLTSHLFNDTYQVTPLDLIGLDEEDYQIAMSAIYIRKYGVK